MEEEEEEKEIKNANINITNVYNKVDVSVINM